MSNKNGIIEKEFNVFREMVINPEASQRQIDECKIAFFAGATAMLKSLDELILDKDKVESQRKFASVFIEIDSFAETIRVTGNVPATEKQEKHYDS